MAIQISGTTVIDNSRNLQCIESVSGNGIATQVEAEAGTVNNQIMTPLRVSQAIAALGGGMVDDDINWSGCNVGCAVRGGGNVFYKSGGKVYIGAPCTTIDTTKPETWPLGYCNGQGGWRPIHATLSTGRDGWFLPDRYWASKAIGCRTYWDLSPLSPGCAFWTSTECTNNSAFVVCAASNVYCTPNYQKGNWSGPTAFAIRVVCY